MSLILNFPDSLLDEHHAWHMAGAHPGYPTRTFPIGTPGSGLEFFSFHRRFMAEFHAWYDNQAGADQAAVAAWPAIPQELKVESAGWVPPWPSDEDRIVHQPYSFGTADDLGIFVELGIHNQFLHGAAAQVYNEPILATFHSPLSTYFYQLHGLVDRWWQAWEDAVRPPVRGNPALVQSRFGQVGNFELVVPLAASGLAHYWRNNDNGSLPWSRQLTFGQGLGGVDAVTMIESNFGIPGNLEVIARVGDRLEFFWRDSGPSFNWNGPVALA
jgi:hypothetical protein